MKRHRATVWTALIAVVGTAALACGTGTTSSSSGSNKGEIKLGVDLPQSGTEASFGLPALNGVKFAVSQIKSVEGYTITLDIRDDAINGVHDPQKGVQNFTSFIADAKVLGVVGPQNSNVTQAIGPISNQAHLSVIGPFSNPCISKDLPGCSYHPKDLRPYGPNNLFRVEATDDSQGGAMADFAYDQLNLKKVAVFSDNETYGKGLADLFKKEFTKKGGTIPVTQDFDTKTIQDFRGPLTSAKQQGAEAVYFGGGVSTKGCVLRSQMNGIFTPATPFMGGDSLQTQDCITDTGAMAANMYTSTVEPDPSQVPEATKVLNDFKQAYPNKNDYSANTIPMYAGTQLMIAAIGRAIKANGGNVPSREQVRSQLASTKNVSSALGTVSLDPAGDIVPQIAAIYVTKGQPLDWSFIKQINYT